MFTIWKLISAQINIADVYIKPEFRKNSGDVVTKFCTSSTNEGNGPVGCGTCAAFLASWNTFERKWSKERGVSTGLFDKLNAGSSGDDS
jgi:hypothetical protein